MAVALCRGPLLIFLISAAACSPVPAPPATLSATSFAFGVFGDGPYSVQELSAYHRLLADVRATNVRWLLHVGDFTSGPCTDSLYGARQREFGAVGHAVVYVPGDNEWTDCHRRRSGSYDPLERLAALRHTFFHAPTRSLGEPALTLETQAADAHYAEFPEQARWMSGGFLFATLHVVGSSNALAPFSARTGASDAEVGRRTAAAIAWLDAAFAAARDRRAAGVVLALHADMGIEHGGGWPAPYKEFLTHLARQVAEFRGEVLLIHGDSHVQRVDHPLMNERGTPFANFTRLETYGSPDIGWIRVVIDSAAGKVTTIEPRSFRQ